MITERNFTSDAVFINGVRHHSRRHQDNQVEIEETEDELKLVLRNLRTSTNARPVADEPVRVRIIDQQNGQVFDYDCTVLRCLVWSNMTPGKSDMSLEGRIVRRYVDCVAVQSRFPFENRT